MKYIKKFESNNNDIDFIDIVNILQDIIDDGYYIVIYSANGVAFYPQDIDDVNKIKTFRFNRWNNDDGKTFKFRIDFDEYKNYNEIVDFLDEMKTEVGRFNDIGFSVDKFYINIDNESDKYNAMSVEYSLSGNG